MKIRDHCTHDVHFVNIASIPDFDDTQERES
jgi:hypothetical protein